MSDPQPQPRVRLRVSAKAVVAVVVLAALATLIGWMALRGSSAAQSPDDDSATAPKGYTAEGVSDLCDEVDPQRYVDTIGAQPKVRPDNHQDYAGKVSMGCTLSVTDAPGGLKKHELDIDVKVHGTANAARVALDKTLADVVHADVQAVDGPWKEAASYVTKDDTRVLWVRDGNLTIQLRETASPHDALTADTSEALMSDYARLLMKRLRG